MRGLWFLIVLLVLAALACTLTSSEEESTPPTPTTFFIRPASPTPLPTTSTGIQPPTVISQLPTQAAGVPTVVPTACTVRSDWLTITVASGDTLFKIAQAVGVSVDELARANCLSDPSRLRVGQTLRVPILPVTAIPTTPCPNRWFFNFSAGKQTTGCPNPQQTMDAVGEDFEGGRVYWYKTSTLGGPDTIYIIYNDGSWEQYIDTWVTGQPESDPTIVPPAGRYQPVRGIGKVWREQPNVRQRLGWAYEPEKYYVGRRQDLTGTTPPGQPGYVLYIDHGVRNLVLALTVRSAANGGSRWEVVGSY